MNKNMTALGTYLSSAVMVGIFLSREVASSRASDSAAPYEHHAHRSLASANYSNPSDPYSPGKAYLPLSSKKPILSCH